jgi:hypothetical protein
MVKTSGLQSFDSQFEPYPRAFMVAPSWCGLGCRSQTDGRMHHPQFWGTERNAINPEANSNSAICKTVITYIHLRMANLRKQTDMHVQHSEDFISESQRISIYIQQQSG